MLKNFKTKLAEKKEIYLRIKVRPKANNNEIKKVMDDNTIKINISAAAKKGQANQKLIKFLAKEFLVLPKNIKIISGHGERLKMIHISYDV